MAIESDTREPEEPIGVGSSGDSDNGDVARIDDPQTTQIASPIGGRILRFAGMGIIITAIVFSTIAWEEPVLIIGCLVIGSAGGAMHYKGRKLAPGKYGASILGGIFGGAIGSAAIIMLMLIFFAMFIDGCQGILGL
jgi:hypothetical protein